MPRGAIVVMVIDVVMGSDGSEGKGWWASGGDAEGMGWWASGAIPRGRYSGRAEVMTRRSGGGERKG